MKMSTVDKEWGGGQEGSRRIYTRIELVRLVVTEASPMVVERGVRWASNPFMVINVRTDAYEGPALSLQILRGERELEQEATGTRCYMGHVTEGHLEVERKSRLFSGEGTFWGIPPSPPKKKTKRFLRYNYGRNRSLQ